MSVHTGTYGGEVMEAGEIVAIGKMPLERISGTVEALKGDRKALKLDDGNWYSVFRSAQLAGVEIGSTVSFAFSVNGAWRNIKGVIRFDGGTLKITGTTPACTFPSVPSTPAKSGYSRGEFPIPLRDGQRSIIRQNALTNARELVVNLSPKTFNIEDAAVKAIDIARIFEKYTAGDSEREAAEGIVKLMEAK